MMENTIEFTKKEAYLNAFFQEDIENWSEMHDQLDAEKIFYGRQFRVPS